MTKIQKKYMFTKFVSVPYQYTKILVQNTRTVYVYTLVKNGHSFADKESS